MRALDVASFLATEPVRKVRIGQTPNQIVHRENNAKLRWFRPTEATRSPVFISMPLINTWTIFDLLPGRSVIAALLEAGTPVYLLDWGRPGPEDKDVQTVDLIDGLLHRAIDRARRHAREQYGATELDAIGYCVGGTFLAAYLARHPEAVRRVALVASPIDFDKAGRLAGWANPETFPVDDVVDGFGNFPRELMAMSFAWLRPTGQVGKWRALYERFEVDGFPELWAAMEAWNGANTDFPGEAYRDYIRSCYFDNGLLNKSWVLGGTVTDLSRCNIPALVLSGSRDHIVPPEAAAGLEAVWGGPVTVRVLKAGHVGMCVGSRLPAALVQWIEQGVEA